MSGEQNAQEPETIDTNLPRLPEVPEGRTDPETLRALRAFHFERDAVEPAGSNGFKPALMAPYLAAKAIRGDYPLTIASGGATGDPASPLCEPFRDLLERLAADTEPGRLVTDNLPRLSATAQQVATEASEPTPARELLREAALRTGEALELGDSDREAFDQGVEKLGLALPEEARVLSLTAITWCELLANAGANRREKALAAWRERAGALVRELDEILAIDDRKQTAREPDGVGGSLGQLGRRFVDTSALAGTLATQRSSEPMSSARRRRVEQARELLVGWERTADPRPLVHGEPATAERLALDASAERPWRFASHADPLQAAAETFVREASELAGVLAAARLARLEIQGVYDPDVHDAGLARFDWQAFDRDELAMLPVVVALLPQATAVEQLPSVSRVLLSGMPVQIVVTVEPAADAAAEAGPLAPELGYLGMGHREAYVHQGSLAAPTYLHEGFVRALAGTRAALHVLDLPSSSETISPLLETGGALDSRAHPIFRFDPDAGSDWATRFELAGNPAIEDDWPQSSLQVTGADGERELKLAFTFADYALLTDAGRTEFRPIEDDVSSAAAVEIARWLELDPEAALHAVPFVWAVSADGAMRRLAISRRLALECQRRRDLWRNLQHFAGVHDPYVEAAREQAREETRQQLDELRQTLEEEHARQLAEQEQRVAREIVQRLVHGLLEGEASAVSVAEIAAAAEAAPISAEPAATAAAPQAQAAEPAAEAPGDAPIEPWIDTPLCTSCNDCTQLNSRMFAYDEDKKAYIKDPRAGTFEQLVRAAEKCPASIIHPGTPLDPSEPNLEKLVKRAEPFQ